MLDRELLRSLGWGDDLIDAAETVMKGLPDSETFPGAGLHAPEESVVSETVEFPTDPTVSDHYKIS